MNALPVKLETIPAALTDLEQWVLWRTVDRGGKATKVPFGAAGEAKSNDPRTWGRFGAVSKRFEAGDYAGIGFMFSHYDEFVGIDLDGCRNPDTGELAPWADDVIKKLDSYSEISPSQTGQSAGGSGARGGAMSCGRWARRSLKTIGSPVRGSYCARSPGRKRRIPRASWRTERISSA